MSTDSFLHGDTVSLRFTQTDDLEKLRVWAEDPDVQPNLRWTGPIPPGEDSEFAQQVLNSSSESLSFVISVDGSDIGCIMLTDIEPEHGTCNVSTWIRTEEQEHGYGTEATSLVVEYAFNTLRLQRVQALSYEYNTPAHAVLNSLGFEQEGTLRHSVYNDGEFHDCYVFGLLDSEFTPAHSNDE